MKGREAILGTWGRIGALLGIHKGTRSRFLSSTQSWAILKENTLRWGSVELERDPWWGGGPPRAQEDGY